MQPCKMSECYYLFLLMLVTFIADSELLKKPFESYNNSDKYNGSNSAELLSESIDPVMSAEVITQNRSYV